MTQAKQILADLQRGKRITPMDALNNYGCSRLSPRIFELKELGYKIETGTVKNKYTGKRYSEYWIERILPSDAQIALFV